LLFKRILPLINTESKTPQLLLAVIEEIQKTLKDINQHVKSAEDDRQLQIIEDTLDFGAVATVLFIKSRNFACTINSASY
jgi:hypothetical protein